eukprot:scaffold4521_cov388-Prasinococcus_capsulatus_cf.AAC.13
MDGDRLVGQAPVGVSWKLLANKVVVPVRAELHRERSARPLKLPLPDPAIGQDLSNQIAHPRASRLTSESNRSNSAALKCLTNTAFLQSSGAPLTCPVNSSSPWDPIFKSYLPY